MTCETVDPLRGQLPTDGSKGAKFFFIGQRFVDLLFERSMARNAASLGLFVKTILKERIGPRL